jgi:hypothetical protein
MKCNTVPAVCQAVEESSDRFVRPTDGWTELLQHLPADLDLEATAHACGALLRRRQVQRAADLLRLILAYAVCDAPLRLAASWYTMSDLGRLSKTAVRQRLKHSVAWLGRLVAALLPLPPAGEAAWPAVRLRLLDATAISRPGSQGTDWRVHLSLDLGQDRLAGIELTDAHGAETLARFPVQEDEIRVGDRGYAHASGLGPVLEAQGHIVVRMNWQNLPLEDSAGQRWDVAAWLQGFPAAASEPQEQALWLPTPQGRFAVRLVACPLPPERAEEARRRARQRARKKKHVVDQRTLLAAGFVLVLTNLPAESWSAAQVLMLYRLRWQIELHIKCLKSVLNLDGLRVQDPEMAQAYLLAKLLAALLTQDLHQQIHLLHPDWWTDRQRPINRWHLTRLAWQVLAIAIIGPLTWTLVISHLIDVRRLVCDEPRKRSPQWLIAQRFLHGMPSC